MKRLGVFVGGTVAFWAILAVPVGLLWGEAGLLQCSVAAAFCLLPAAATMAWALWAFKDQAPEQQVLSVLGGTGVRLLLVLGGGLALAVSLPESFPESFWFWLLAFYLFTLALEIILIVGQSAGAGQEAKTSPAGEPGIQKAVRTG
jgi:hypothetical protein